jgi:hypothetical protein
MTDQGQIRSAAASVRSARQAIHTATARRAAAVVAAQDLADAAHAAERAEQDAARDAAGIHLLTAAQLTPPQIAALCDIPPDDIHGLSAGTRRSDLVPTDRDHPAVKTAPGRIASPRPGRQPRVGGFGRFGSSRWWFRACGVTSTRVGPRPARRRRRAVARMCR